AAAQQRRCNASTLFRRLWPRPGCQGRTVPAGGRVGPVRNRQQGRSMVERQNIFPESLSRRVVKGQLLYTPVVTVVAGTLGFVSGILSRNDRGEIVGKGDMRAQIRQVFANITVALAAAGAKWSDVVTFTTDIDAYFQHIDARTEFCGEELCTSTA